MAVSATSAAGGAAAAAAAPEEEKKVSNFLFSLVFHFRILFPDLP